MALNVVIAQNKNALGEQAALKGAEFIREAIARKGEAHIIVATGASQFEMLEILVKQDIDWSKITAFHLDEYIGIPATHPASFRKYLKERFVEKVALKEFHYVQGDAEPYAECKRLGSLIAQQEIDVAFVGIGENGHLAFNDPPADFDTDEAYLVVQLDEACRQQQLGEGWFKTLNEVPQSAISMSIKQILKSQAIICTVPDQRKAMAVKNAVEGSITPQVPASVLQKHPQTYLFLDKDSSSLLSGRH
ncbi:MAG: glucosamine-6-phosphate deaminase [Deferribacteres bacterium]|nr:glucosamine-6-phosphate deaminase [candidate division KSB1 bacterium]MCB9500334.1 glucosamine-6-phosphate deaminase [Deferribacteres bacterium]